MKFGPLYLALVGAVLSFSAVGCGDGEAQKELDFARESVQTALDAWKRGEKADSLQSRSPAIEFHDENWQRSAALLDYKIGQVFHEADGAPRCAVTLTVQNGKQAAEEVALTYQVNTRPKVVIARDPYL